MSAPFLFMKKLYYHPLIAVLFLCAFAFFNDNQSLAFISIIFMLLYPFIDPHWRKAPFPFNLKFLAIWLMIMVLILGLTLIYQIHWRYILATTLLVALPEEWFFRAYFMQRMGLILQSPLAGNVITSGIFALLHVPVQGWFGLTVFLPSMLFGWIYQRTDDLVMVILVHAFSNLLFIYYLADFMLLQP